MVQYNRTTTKERLCMIHCSGYVIHHCINKNVYADSASTYASFETMSLQILTASVLIPCMTCNWTHVSIKIDLFNHCYVRFLFNHNIYSIKLSSLLLLFAQKPTPKAIANDILDETSEILLVKTKLY